MAFKKGDIVECVDRGGADLTVGKEYTVINTDCTEIGTQVINDYGKKWWCYNYRFKIKTSNMELKITAERVRAAAAKCSTAKQTLETLFPEAFEEDKRKIVYDGSILYPGLKYENAPGGFLVCADRNKLFLSSDYDWDIVKSDGGINLIPTRKTE